MRYNPKVPQLTQPPKDRANRGSDSTTRTCPICYCEHQIKPIAEVQGSGSNSDGRYVAVRCPKCTVAAAYPMPAAEVIRDFYASYPITQTEPEIERDLIQSHEPLAQFLLKKLENPKNAKFLEYGFGAGCFLMKVELLGHSAFGVEFNDDNCAHVSQLSKGKIGTLNLRTQELAELGDRQFDCLVMLQLIEHLPNPLQTLSELSPYIRKGGLIYLECPHEDALFLKGKNLVRGYFNRYNFYGSLNPPHHLHGFNRKSMKALLNNAGFEIVELKDYGFADGFHQLETKYFYPSFADWTKNPHKWGLYPIAKTMIRMTEKFSRVLGLGGGLVALARKP